MSQDQTAAEPGHPVESPSGEAMHEQGLLEAGERQQSVRLNKYGRCAAQVLWPAFMGAAMSVGLFFSAIDPLQIELVGVNLVSSRPAAYTIGFFLFWLLFIISGTVTWFLANSENEKFAASSLRQDTKGTGTTRPG